MIYKQNPLTGDWLCYVPGTSLAYYVPTKKKAVSMCKEFNDLHTVIYGEIRQKISQ